MNILNSFIFIAMFETIVTYHIGSFIFYLHNYNYFVFLNIILGSIDLIYPTYSSVFSCSGVSSNQSGFFSFLALEKYSLFYFLIDIVLLITKSYMTNTFYSFKCRKPFKTFIFKDILLNFLIQ